MTNMSVTFKLNPFTYSFCFKLFFDLLSLKKFFFYLRFNLCKAEQPLQGMELQEKEAEIDWGHRENLFRKNLQLKDVC